VTTSPDSLRWAEPEAASAQIGHLYKAHGRMVVGLCRFLLRDPVEAEDAAQQSFVAAHRSLLRGSVPRDAPAWLATIARNECRARIKQRMREPLALAEPDDAVAQLPDPFHAAVENADLEALRAGLEDLPESQRSAFVLREFAGLSYTELAAALDVSEPAVESLLVRARTKLRLTLSRANPLVLPIVLRDQIVRLATCWDNGSVGAAAKIASLPLAAKLAAAGTSAVLVVAGGAGVEQLGDGHREALVPPAPAVHAAARTIVVHRRSTRPHMIVPRRHEDLRSSEHRGDRQGRTGVRPAPARDVSGRRGRDDGSALLVSDAGTRSGEDTSDASVGAVTPSGSSGSPGDGVSGSGGDDTANAKTAAVQLATSNSGPGDGGTSRDGGDVSGSSSHGSADGGDSSSSQDGGSGSGSGSGTSGG